MNTADDLFSQVLDDVEDGDLTLPILPEVAHKVRQVVDDPKASAGQVSKIVSMDPALSARLLKVANSPLYRGKNEVIHVQMATARLGSTLVRNIVTSLVMDQLFKCDPKSDAYQCLRDIWTHSTKVAAISNVIARKYTSLSADQAMLSGLIHDIGSMPIITRAAQYPELFEDKSTLLQIVAAQHTDVGKAILESWEFPEALIAVAAEHENVYRDHEGAPDYVDLVIVANLHSHFGTEHHATELDWNNIPAFEKFGLGPEESIAAMEEAREEIAEVQKVLSV